MKKLFKLAFRLVLLALVLVGVLVLLRNMLLRSLLEQRLARITGLTAVVGKVEFGLREPLVRLQNVRLITPRPLGTRSFVDIPEVRFTYDRNALLSRRLRVPTAFVQLHDLYLARGADGLSTQTILRRNLQRGPGLVPALVSPLTFDGVDSLTFSFERYKYLDYHQMNLSQELLVGLKNGTATNLRSGDDFVALFKRVGEERGIKPPPLDPGASAAPTTAPLAP